VQCGVQDVAFKRANGVAWAVGPIYAPTPWPPTAAVWPPSGEVEQNIKRTGNSETSGVRNYHQLAPLHFLCHTSGIPSFDPVPWSAYGTFVLAARIVVSECQFGVTA
jgi:hypothetical protein